MNKTRKKNIVALPKRKWAKRGRAIADFTASIVFTVIEHVIDFGIWIGRKIYLGISSLRRKPKASSKEVNIQVNEPMFKPVPKSSLENISFNSVIGLEDAKEQIYQRLILPFKHREKAEILKIAKGGGVLIYGPPGNGKSTLAKAVAKIVNAPFFHITPSDIVRNGMGVSVQRIAELFRILKSYSLAILFIDDVDGLIASRSTNSVIMRSIIHQFLIEMDGLETKSTQNTLLVLSATNKIWIIDKAMKRTGRFDERIYVGLPDITARELMLKKNMEEIPASEGIDFNQIARMTEMFSGADLKGLVCSVKQRAFSRSILLEGKKTVSAVTMSDFTTALETFKPTITESELPEYGAKEMTK